MKKQLSLAVIWINRFSFFSTTALLLANLFLAMPAFATTAEPTSLGNISFPTSASPAAETYFLKGVLYLHNFEYDRAQAAFQQAEKVDPDFALAYWGDAMTYNHPIWNEQNLAAGKAALAKLAATNEQRVEKAKTPKEKGLIKAVNVLFGEGDKAERDAAYADLMGTLYDQYPNDDEIAAFYALALLGKTEGTRDIPTYMQAAAVVEEISQHNPLHPGALHYAIHAYDDPAHAPLGLRAARVYAKAAPDASHALHMPSHIFLALGMWDDVITSNKAGWLVGVKNNPKDISKNYTIDDLHALQWLSYGYLQKRDYKQAYPWVKIMEKIASESNTPMAKFYYALMRAAYIMESGDLTANLKSLDMNEMEFASRAANLQADALIALHNHNNSAVTEYINELNKLGQATPSSDHTDYFVAATPTGSNIAKITALQLQAQIKLQEGNIKDAIKLLQEATLLEDHLKIGYGPPTPIKPSHELLADVLLLDNQYENAYREYIVALKLIPNRALTQLGLRSAKEKLKKHGLPEPERLSPYVNKLMNANKAGNITHHHH